MNGYPRFLAENILITPEDLLISSERLGEVGAALAVILGDGVCHAQGDYSGSLATEQFVVEIDSVAAGTDVGQATYRWKGGARTLFEGNNQTTHDALIELRDGVSIRFDGEGFKAGDIWYIEANRENGRAALFQTDPAELWHSTQCALVTMSADLGVAQNVLAMILADHNLSDAATVVLKGGGDVVDWDSPDYQAEIPISHPHLLFWLDEAWAQWRLEIADPTNPDGIIKASQFYLGGYTQLSRRMNQGATFGPVANRSDHKVGGGLVGASVGTVSYEWKLAFGRLGQADRAALLAVFHRAHDAANGLLRPIWFIPDHLDISGLLWGFLPAKMPFVLSNPSRAAVSAGFVEHA